MAESGPLEGHALSSTHRLATACSTLAASLSMIGPPGRLGACDRPVKSRLLLTHVSYRREMEPHV